jgi:hypothetical protein
MRWGWKGLGVAALLVVVGCGGPVPEEAGSEALESLAQVEQQARDSTPRDSAHASRARWVQVARGDDDDALVGLEHDREGNVIVVGNYEAPIDFGQGRVGPERFRPWWVMVISKYRSDGKLLWYRFLMVDQPGEEVPVSGTATSMAVDRNGDVVLTGLADDELELEDGRIPRGSFIARFDRHGRFVWARPMPGGGEGYSLVLVPQGGMLLLGSEYGPSDEDLPFGNIRPVVRRLDAEGRLLWTYVEPRPSSGGALTVDSRGALYLVGNLIRRDSAGVTDGTPFIRKLSPDGQPLWTQALEGASGTSTSVAVHGNRVVMGGSFSGRFTLRGKAFATPLTQGFVAAFTRDGEERWAAQLGTDRVLLDMDQRDGVLVTGTYHGSQDFGLGYRRPPGAAGEENLYVARFDRIHGELSWLNVFPGSAVPQDLSVTKRGEAAVGGFINGTVDFGVQRVGLSLGGEDIFILQLAR